MSVTAKPTKDEKNGQATQSQDCCAAKDKSAQAQHNPPKPQAQTEGSCCCGSKGHHTTG